MDTLKDFAKKLQVAFPALKAVTITPYIPGEYDAGVDEDGFPYLVDVTLYSEKGAKEIESWNNVEEPMIWRKDEGWSVEEGFIATIPLCIKEQNDAVQGMDAVPLDLKEFTDKYGNVNWREVIAFL